MSSERQSSQWAYTKVADAICQRIIRGDLSAMDRLPTEAELAEQTGINRVTVSRGYRLLQERGIIVQKRGRGSFVASAAERLLGLPPRRRLRNVACVFAAASLSHILATSRFISLDLLFGISKRFEGMAVNVCYLPVAEPRLVTRELVERFDGFILIGSSGAGNRLVTLAHEAGLPCLAAFDEPPSSLPLVTYDRAQAVRSALDHLVQRGYRKIGFAGLIRDESNPTQDLPKLQTFRQFMAERRLEVDPAWVIHGGKTPGEAYKAAMEFAASKAPMPEAFFIDTDYRAMEMMHAFATAGIRVPEQLAICGFDDIPDTAMVRPALTTVRTPRQEIGYQAADLLLTWLPGEPPPADRLLTATLIIRETTPQRK